MVKNKKITIDDLAVMIKKGFDQTVSRDEFGDFKKEMHGFKIEMLDFKRKSEECFLDLISRMDSVEKRLNAIENVLGPLLQVSSVLQNEIREINMRVDQLERKVESRFAQ